MRKLLFIIILYLPICGFSQYWEVGAFLGISNYAGDLSPDPVVFKETHGAYGALVRYNVSEWFTLKANIYYGQLSGSDRNADAIQKRQRNLHFRTTILDIGFQPEINIRGYKSGTFKYRSSPYIFFGLSVYRFNPEAKYADKWISLQPLGTEGQGTTKYNDREKYALTQICIPFGVGWKHALSRNWNLGIEFGFRKTFTDYLDDVSTTFVEPDILEGAHGEISKILSNRSGEIGTRIDYQPTEQRGDANNKDWYYFSGLTVTYLIKNNR